YTLIAHFVLPERCWTENYYARILARPEDFLRRYDYSDAVRECVEAGREEGALHGRYEACFRQVLYLAQKTQVTGCGMRPADCPFIGIVIAYSQQFLASPPTLIDHQVPPRRIQL